MTDLLALATAVAREAGALLLDRLPDARTDVEAKSTPTDLVSEVDRAAEALIVSRLRDARPDDAVLAEEGTFDTGTSGLRWVVDPLDGTINYLYRRDGFAVSIGLEDGAGTLLGVVYDPQRDELFAAERGGGATCNGVPLRCADLTDLGHALVATGFAYSAAVRATQAAALPRVLPAVRDIRRAGAATLDLCAVAARRVDAYFERGLAPWDFSAGGLVAAEAGAIVVVLPTPDREGAVTVAAAPGVFDALVLLLADAGVVA